MEERMSSRFLPPLPKIIAKDQDQTNVEDLKSKRSRRRSQKAAKIKTVEPDEERHDGDRSEFNAKRENVFAITRDFKNPHFSENNGYTDGVENVGDSEVLQPMTEVSNGYSIQETAPVRPKRKKAKKLETSERDNQNTSGREQRKGRKKKTVDFEDSCTNPFETGIDDQAGRRSPTLMPSGDGHREPPSHSLGKLFIEQPKGFVPVDHSKLSRGPPVEPCPVESSKPVIALDVAINVQHCFCIFGRFLCGLFAGIALWQCVISYHLGSPMSSLDDYLDHYKQWTTTIQSLFFIFSVITTVFALDRYDISALQWNAVKELLFCQNGLIVIFIYPTVLILSLSITHLDYKIGEYAGNSTQSSWSPMTDEEKYEEIIYWRNMNTVRCIGAVLGGIIVSLISKEDSLSQYLKSIRDEDDKIPAPEHPVYFS